MTKPISIERITKDNGSYLKDMTYLAIHVEEGQAAPDIEVLNEPRIRMYYEYFGKETDLGYYAVDQDTGNVVGAIWLRLFSSDNPGYGHVDGETPELSMAIDKAFRGRGIGTQLMEHLLEACAERYPNISLSVDPSNRALHLYQRYGFKECGMIGTSVTMLLRRR